MGTWRRDAKSRRVIPGAGCGLLAALMLLFSAPSSRAAEASWEFQPSSWDFGTVLPESGPTAPKAFVLENTGEVELSVMFVAIGSVNDGGCAIDENNCGKLAPGATCAISVTFDPGSAGPKQGSLSVASKDGLAPSASVELKGAGAGPAVAIAPASQSFDPRDVGAGPSPARTFEVSNTGVLDLSIASVSLTNFWHPNADQFQLAGGSCAAGVVVPPGDSCTVEVAFAPTAPGFLAADLQIADDAPGSPHLATVEGVGIAPPWTFPPPPPFVAPRASIVHRPAKETGERHAAFWFRGSATAARFVCKLDHRVFRACESPTRYDRLSLGAHRFAVQAIDGNGRRGPVTRFRWKIEAS